MRAARYVTSGNAKHWQTPAYKRTSSLGGAFQTTRTLWPMRAAILFAFVVLLIATNPELLL
jgi:hypothetical protein